MSSGTLPPGACPPVFTWSDELDPRDYLIAQFRITTALAPERAALGMAMEQSATTVRIRGYLEPEDLEAWTIRVRSVAPAPPAGPSEVPGFALTTEAYGGEGLPSSPEREWDVELAFPLRALMGRPSQLLNVLVGELPRLGFLTRFRVISAPLPAGFGPGPAFGVEGLRRLAGRPAGPLLCRSMRPAVGLSTEVMARLNRDVLEGGFHVVKDDELAGFATLEAFKFHIRAMVVARDEARERSGERKLYLATLICEPEEWDERWEAVLEAGVDGILVAPFIQGPGILTRVARQATLPVLAHNTFGDLLTRHPGWGLRDEVVLGWLRQWGADWTVLPGDTGDKGPGPASGSWRDALLPDPGGRALMPILQGGKRPEGLEGYRSVVGSDDFMLIVASWVDGHPDGLKAAARRFREAVDAGI